jgi:hypothetical protein|nr:MAG TPA: hypothetical protein [Caudoviricetes sp.]
MTDVSNTLNARSARYGTFSGQAGISQTMKNFMRQSPNWDSLDPDMAEALDMIQHKIARILNGDPRYADSWHDIAGYAALVDKRLNGDSV